MGSRDFDPTHAVTMAAKSLSNSVQLEFKDLVDQSGDTASIGLEVFSGGKLVSTVRVQIGEPGGTFTFESRTAFDSIRVKSAEDDLTGRLASAKFAPIAPKAQVAEPSTGNWGAFEKEVITLTNAERAKAGLPALRSHPELNAAADAHAEDMAKNHYFSHTSLNKDLPWDRAEKFGYDSTGFAENIARGQQTPEQVVDDWMNSSGHRANIMNGSYADIGVGYDHGYWVQDFGTGDHHTAIA